MTPKCFRTSLLLLALVTFNIQTGCASQVSEASRQIPTKLADRSVRADPLSSWNDGATKSAITTYVEKVTKAGSPDYIPPAERIATFDQDGTLWVEQPMYTQVVYCMDRVAAVAAAKPELKDVEPFKTVLSGDKDAISKLTNADLEKIAIVAITGIPTEQFREEVKAWMATAKHPRWKRPYTELAYQPMLELMQYLRTKEFKTYIVTGSGQDFVRVYGESVFGLPPEQIIGTAIDTKYGYSKSGAPELMREPKLLLNDNNGGKPEGIHMVIGRRSVAAFGNSTGDQQMLEYNRAGGATRLSMIVLHDDARREYAYGPAHGLPDSKVGTFTQALYDEAQKDGWTVISMKNDWKRIFAFEPMPE